MPPPLVETDALVAVPSVPVACPIAKEDTEPVPDAFTFVFTIVCVNNVGKFPDDAAHAAAEPEKPAPAVTLSI